MPRPKAHGPEHSPSSKTLRHYNSVLMPASLAEVENGIGLSIRGSAGPYTVVASNFAPGTTGADVQSAMEPIGGELQSCRIVANSPTVIAEMVFTAKSGAENVISTFNNQKVSSVSSSL